jgi:hypothetical protein
MDWGLFVVGLLVLSVVVWIIGIVPAKPEPRRDCSKWERIQEIRAVAASEHISIYDAAAQVCTAHGEAIPATVRIGLSEPDCVPGERSWAVSGKSSQSTYPQFDQPETARGSDDYGIPTGVNRGDTIIVRPNHEAPIPVENWPVRTGGRKN